ncbi:contractile injection system protein, VgrG/Pvc8 family [Kribbella sp. NPDC051952]|uniref:phage late control D family protein n=1 Tax=Kribbella sp. NPDC051952 TaxID=3154851 RepID=UPI003434E4D4
MTEPHPYAGTAPVFDVDGTHRGELGRDVLRIDVAENTAGLRTFVGHFHAVGPQSDGSTGQLSYLDGKVVTFGQTLKVTIGPPEAQRQIFDGRISALEVSFTEGGTPYVSVYAEDVLMKLRMTRRSHTYEDTTDANIAKAIATEHSLTATVDADGPTYSLVQQWNQSDLAFLRERAALVNAEVWAQGTTLCFQSRIKRTATQITLVQGNTLLDAQLRADLAHQRDVVTVTGWDHDAADVIESKAEAGVIQREVTGGRTGVSILGPALGSRAGAWARRTPVNAKEATAWAEADYLRRARQFVRVDGVTSGTPDLTVGSRLTLERVGPIFEGAAYYATSVHHSYDLSVGFRTRFSAERATVSA